MKNTVRILCIVLMALLLCTGLIACAHKEAADHTATGEWLSDENNHWHACEKEKCEDAGDRAAHEFDNACDADCNVCGYKRTPAAHAYDNACDTACNVCGATREITHTPATALTAGDTTHWYACTVCGAKTGEAAHTFDKTVAHADYLKAAATETTKAQYWKSCVCGAKSATEYFESDKAPANLEITSDISKTYDGTPVLEPLYDSDGPGGEYFEYWQGTTKLSGKPTDAGTYKVVVGIYECETHAGDRVEREFTIAKKTLNYLNLTKVYDGKAGYNDSVFFLDTTHGLVAGDVVSIETNDDAEYNVGTYTLTDTSGRWELDDCIYLEGADAANYAFNYQANGAVATITVTPKALVVDATKVYDGNMLFSGVVVNGVGTEKLNVTFSVEQPNVQLHTDCYDYDAIIVTGVGDAKGSNYVVTEAYGTITPIEKSFTLSSKSYNGTDEFVQGFTQLGGNLEYRVRFVFTLHANNGDGNLLKDAGEYTNVKIESYTAYTVDEHGNIVDVTPNFVLSQETLNQVAPTFTIYRVDLTSDVDFSFEYNGTSGRTDLTHPDFTEYAFGDDIITATISGNNTWNVGTYYLYTQEQLDQPGFVPQTPYEIITLNGPAAANYFLLDENDSLEGPVGYVTITPKKLSDLELYITADTYATGEITLLPKDGIVAGEVVKISITNVNDQDFWEGFSIDMQLASGTAPDAYRYETIALVASGDYANYELVTHDDGEGYQVVGVVKGIASCDVQFDGSCACGTKHIDHTFSSADIVASVPVGPVGGITWEGGIYALNTLYPGYWNIKPNENFCTTTVYDSEGKVVTMKGFEFYAAKAGTYYVHVGKNSDPVSGDTITFRFAEEIFDVSSNQSGSYESNSINGVSDGEYWFKVNSDMDWGESLAIFDGNEQEIDPAKYTVKAYDANFNLIPDVVYEDLQGQDIYIAIVLKEALEFYIAVHYANAITHSRSLGCGGGQKCPPLFCL